MGGDNTEEHGGDARQNVSAGRGPASVFGHHRPAVSRKTARSPLRGPVDVAVDKAGQLGLLTYHVAADMVVVAGDAVEVPFGAGSRTGMVVGEAQTPDKATKTITLVHGCRADASDVALARTIATYHFATTSTVVARLSPASGRSAGAAHAEHVSLNTTIALPTISTARTLLLADPCADICALGANEAARMVGVEPGGQVLIICPTVKDVTDTLACFDHGAMRLDSKAPDGAWKGFVEGHVRVGVGTRAAVLYAGANLVGIVVLRPENGGHLEMRQPRTHARDIASARSRALGIQLSLVSAAPGPSDLYAVAGNVCRVGGGWPKLVVADRAAARARGEDSIVPTTMRAVLRESAREGQKVYVLASRDVAIRRCTACRSPAPCVEDGCEGGGACRHGQEKPCETCGKHVGVRITGWDKPRLSNLLGKGVNIISIAELDSVAGGGTVIIFDYDALTGAGGWFPDVDATATVVRAAAAAGEKGTVVIATSGVEGKSLRDIVLRHDPLPVARRALTEAREHMLPPYGRVVTLRVGGDSPPSVKGWPGKIAGPTKKGDEWVVVVNLPNEALPALGKKVATLRRKAKTTLLVR